MSDDIQRDDKVVQDNLAELTAPMRKQVQLTEENVKAANTPAANQQLLNFRTQITRVAALIIVSAGLAALAVQPRPTSATPPQIRSFGQAFFLMSILGGVFIVLVDVIGSIFHRAIWGEVNTRALPSTQSPAPPTGVPRAKFWAGSVIVLVIAVGVVVFGVQGQRFAAQDQQRRDCLQLKITRLQENRLPLPPPPPPLLPGTKVSPELEATMKRLEAQRQKLTEDRRKWETNELPKIRERRMALEKKLAAVQCDALQ